MCAVGVLHRRGLHVRDVAPRVGLRDGDADPFAAEEDIRQEARLQRRVAEGVERGGAVRDSDGERAAGADGAGAGHLVAVDAAVEGVEVVDGQVAGEVGDAEVLEPGGGERRGERGDQHAGCGEGGVDVGGDLFGLFPFEGVWGEVLVDELAAGALPFAVGGRVVGGGDAVEPGGFGEGDGVGRDEGSGHGGWRGGGMTGMAVLSVVGLI